jgi:mono/diheme cytochrome c family protein
MAARDSHQSMPGESAERAYQWFQRFVWAGIFANVGLGLTGTAFPAETLQFLRLEPGTPLVWPRFAAFMLLLITGFYVFAAIDPQRFAAAASYAVVCRFAGVAFFAVVGGRYIVFALFDLAFGAPQAISLYLARRRRRAEAEGRATRSGMVAVIAGLLALGGFGYGAFQWLTFPIVPAFASDAEQFKYGSIGNDAATGIPYPIWVAIPDVCSDLLPRGKGYDAFGFLWEPGRNFQLDPPIGFSRVRAGVERMAINCAICHTTRARLSPDDEPRLYFGGASNTVDIQAYQRFLARCAADGAFTADNLIAAMKPKVPLSWLDRVIYRYALIPYVRHRLAEQGRAFAWANRRPPWGPGRIDPFNPVKFGMLGLVDDGTVGNSDMQTVWNLQARERIRSPAPLHWDGLNTSIREVVISSALGDGMVAREFDSDSVRRIETYLRELPPPPSPHRPDPAAVERGRTLYAAQCAACHAPDGARTLTVIPAAEVGTDSQRVHMWTETARDTYNNYREGYDWDFKAFRKVSGYVAEPLAGAWLNAPYLHNGSVPTLRDLLMQPAERPVTFVRGLDLIDGRNGGFVAPPCDPRRPPAEGFCYDTRLIGNSNRGHLYGTTLPDAEKSDLLAYLLTY